ncbi:DUF3383 family protein [Faecalibacillus faecis]|uniref:DUF3383 family protein n=1 Tax=Faecalibacillus faecis TaxID=1982628 RepID=UPI00386CEE52
MATGQIALSNTINVTLGKAPSGLGEYSTNSIVLLTNEQPLSAEPYIWAVNAQDAVNEYGSNSLTAKMARALFTPAFNLRTGGGQVLIYPFSGVNATACKAVTIAITDTILTALKLVTTGSLKITLDGTAYEVTNMDFTAVKTVEDIVKILNAQGLDCDITVVDTNKIQFQSRKYGATDSTIVFSAASTGTDIGGSSYLDTITNATITAGTNSSGKTVAEAIAEVDEIAYVGGVLTTQYCENAAVLANATALQALDHIYFEVTQSLKNISVLGANIKAAADIKTRPMAYSYTGAEGAKCAIATYATIACSTNYSGNSTVLTMNLKELTGILPDLNLNQTYYTQAKQNGVDIYGNTEGLSCVYSFDNGAYTDEVTGELWLKKALEVSGFNYLRKTNTKIPQTEAGMTGLKNAYESRLVQAVRNGLVAPGAWNDSIPFGNPEDFLRNIEEKGYYIYSLPIAQQQQAEREQRIAPVVQIAIKLAGAFHSSNVIVNVQR